MHIWSKAFLLLVLLPLASIAGESAGFSVEVFTSGFFLNPTLEKLTVAQVEANSPAKRAGLAVDDEVIEINGRKVPGSNARETRTFMEARHPADGLVLRVLRAGQVLVVTVREPVR